MGHQKTIENVQSIAFVDGRVVEMFFNNKNGMAGWVTILTLSENALHIKKIKIVFIQETELIS